MEQAVARAVAGATDAGDAYTRALQAIAQALEWPLAAAWEPDATDPDQLRCVAIWAADEEGPRAFADLTRTLPLRRGEGLPGRVWRTGRPAWITDAALDGTLDVHSPVGGGTTIHAEFPCAS